MSVIPPTEAYRNLLCWAGGEGSGGTLHARAERSSETNRRLESSEAPFFVKRRIEHYLKRPSSVSALILIPIHRLAYQCSHRHGDKTEVMESVVFGVCLGSSDYESCCTSRAFLAHNREETVFASARPHRVVLFYQSVSPDQSRGANRGVRGTL